LIIFTCALHANFAPIPLRTGQIQAAQQDAIIWFNEVQEQEALILQTELTASRDVDALFFMPLPSEPTVAQAPADLFAKMQALVEEKGLHYSEDWMFKPLESSFKKTTSDKQNTASTDAPEYSISLAQIKSVEDFISCVEHYVAQNKIETDFDLDKVRETVRAYINDGIHYFLFYRVALKATEQQTQPLVIEFKSDTVYYPLRVNKLYDGPSDVQLMVLSKTRIPGARFEQIGFFKTKQVILWQQQVQDLWTGFTERSDGPLNFQCFRLVDPRSWFREIKPFATEREYRLHQSYLQRQAFYRWNHDVSVSLTWGKRNNPTYTIAPMPDIDGY
jgi:hypothetical protein